MTSEGDTATQEVPVSLPAAKVEETGDVLDSGFSLEDAMPKTSGAKNGKKGFLVDSDSKDPLYTSDEWRVQNFKVVTCSKRYAHDWTICPFAHPGEKARRRDPKQFTYAGIACPDMKKAGFCGRGDSCPYAHNVFEYWLHPTRYRTQLCNDGCNCTRNVCFFAHSLEEMRPVSGKAAEVKKAGRDGRVSPDTPLLTGGSTNSAASTDMWSGLSAEDRVRQSGLLAEDIPYKAQASNIDEVMYNLANVKLAMAGDRKHEVITMLSQLLHEAVGEKHKDALPPLGASAVHADLGALKGLNLEGATLLQAQALLAASQAGHKQDMGPAHGGEAWQQTLQDMLRNDRQSILNNRSQQQSLFTAPAGLDRPALSGGLDYASDPSRGFSGDLGLPPSYPQTRNFWQNKDAVSHAQRTPAQVFRHMSQDLGEEAGHSQLAPSLLEGGMFSNTAANPSALRCQSFNLDDLPASQMMGAQAAPRRETRRPPISAFQSAASQDWKTAPGRGRSSELQWGNSGQHSLPSMDLNTIAEGVPHYDQLMKQQPSMDSFPSMSGPLRSTGTGGFDTGFNLMPAPLAFPTHQRGGRDPSALHSAPYDLSFAYRNGPFDGPPQQAARRNSMDRSGQLQGWGGLNGCDFGTSRF